MRTSLPGTTNGTSPPQTESPRENAGGFSGVMQDQIHGMASFDDDPYSSHTAAVISQTLRHQQQQQHQQQQGYGQQADTTHHPTQLQSVFGGSPHLITHHQMSGDGFAEHGVMGAEHGVMGADHIAPPAHHHQQDIVSLGAAAGRRPDLPQWIVGSGEAPHTPPDPSSSHVTFLPPPPMQRLTPPSGRPQPGEVMGEGSFMTQQSAEFMRFQPSANFRPLPKPKRSSKKANAPAKPKGTPGRKRKVPDYELSPAEANRRHIRRERNKIAAAKCRNRRRELTDRLQGETDVLENELHNLNQEVQSLLQEKDQLEFILASHAPQCKASTSRDQPAPSLVPPTFAPDPAFTPDPTSFTHHIFPATSTSDHATDRRRHDNADPTEARFGAMSLGMLEPVEDDDAAPMNTPVCTLVTPSLQATNYPVFTFPSTHLTPDSFGVKTEFSSSGKGMPPPPPYGASSSSYPAHPHSSYPSHPHSSCASQLRQRSSSSSSSHHSYDSLQSPKLLTL